MNVQSISSVGFDPQAMFKKLDANGDGGVDKNEFLAGAKGKDGSTDTARAETMFTKIDTSGDGVIDASENAAAAQKMAAKGQGGRPSRAGGAGGAKPAGGASTSSSSQKSSSTSANQTYDPMDADEDGVVTAQERMAYALKLIEEKKQAEESSRTYTQRGNAAAFEDGGAGTFSFTI